MYIGSYTAPYLNPAPKIGRNNSVSSNATNNLIHCRSLQWIMSVRMCNWTKLDCQREMVGRYFRLFTKFGLDSIATVCMWASEWVAIFSAPIICTIMSTMWTQRTTRSPRRRPRPTPSARRRRQKNQILGLKKFLLPKIDFNRPR